MGARTMTTNLSRLSTKDQKAYLGSRIAQNHVAPMELKLLRMQMRLAAALEGHQWEQLDDKELQLITARNEIAALEARLVAFTAACMMEYSKREEENDGQQRIDGI